VGRQDKSLPILAEIVLQRGLAKHHQIDKVLATRVYDPSISLASALSQLPDVNEKFLSKLTRTFLKDDNQFSSLLLSIGLIDTIQFEDALKQQKTMSENGVLVRSSSLLARKGIELKIGGYVLDKCLGAGTMGVVFSASKPEASQSFALKIIRADIIEDDNSLQRFFREAKAMMSIKHPNVVAYHDSGREGEVVYLVFELVEGQNLRELLNIKGQLSVPQAVKIMAKLFEGLQAIHDAGITHRDLKPDNVLLSLTGVPKITDFGLARREDNAESLALTMEGSLLGTPHYMSPEQCRGEKANFSADLYAMGAMFFHLIAGEPPFASCNLHVIIEKHLHEEPPNPREIGAPASVAKIILQLLSKRSSDRGASAREIGFYLREIMAQGVTEEIVQNEAGPLATVISSNDVQLSSPTLPTVIQKPTIKGLEGATARAEGSAWTISWKLLVAFGIALLFTIGFTLLPTNSQEVSDLSPDDLGFFVGKEFQHYNNLKSDSRKADQALAEIQIILYLMENPKTKAKFDQRFFANTKVKLKFDSASFLGKINRTATLITIFKERLPQIEKDLGSFGFRGAELKLTAIDLIYGASEEVARQVTQLRDRDARERGLTSILKLNFESSRAHDSFRLRFNSAILAKENGLAAQIAWDHYQRYGNAHGRASEVLHAFGKALTKADGKLPRDQYRLRSVNEGLPAIADRFKSTMQVWLGPFDRPQTWCIAVPALITALLLLYMLFIGLIRGLSGGYYFIRWGGRLKFALARGQIGRAAAIAEKAGMAAMAGDLYVEAKEFTFAAQVFLAANQDRRAAAAYERGGKFDAAGSIYERLSDFLKAAELQLKLGNFDRAGQLFVRAKALARAADAYTKGGQSSKAAEILVNEGRPVAAAKLLADAFEKLKGKGAPNSNENIPEQATNIARLFAEGEYHEDAAHYFVEAGHLEEAADHFVQADLPRDAAELYIKSNQIERAVDLLHEIGDIRAASLLSAELYQEDGDFETAAVEFERIGNMDKASLAWEKHGDFTRAARCAKRGKDETRNAEMLEQAGDFDRAGDAYSQSEQPLEAIRCYEAAGNFAAVAEIREQLSEFVKAAQAWLKVDLEEEALLALKCVDENDPEYFDGLAIFAKTAGEREGHDVVRDKLARELQSHEIDRYSVVAFRALANAHEQLSELVEARTVTGHIGQAGYANEEDRARLQRIAGPRRMGAQRGPRSSHAGHKAGRMDPRSSATNRRRTIGQLRPTNGPSANRQRRPTGEEISKRSGEIKGSNPTSRQRPTGWRLSSTRTASSTSSTRGRLEGTLSADRELIDIESRFVGRTIDRYDVSKVIGEGAYAWVLKARHRMLDREVALKVLKPLNNDMEMVKQRFLAEGRVISKLKHPSIVELYDFGETEDGLLYMCLEYLDGEDLRDYLKGKPNRELKHVTKIMLLMLHALKAAHDVNVVHRDLKPENVFLVLDGTLRVLDFGIAKVVQESQTTADRFKTKEGTFLGTPKYCSPEQALGEDTGPWTDIYGAALIYYEMLTGEMPFKSQNALGYLTHHASSKPASPRTHRPDLSIEVERTILRALNKKPMQRYPSVTSFIKALEALISA
jgi:serine/threonine protein kinase/tetratricopeptide (TPR) repeat protein